MSDKFVAPLKVIKPKEVASASVMPVTRLISRPSSIEIVNGELVPVRALTASR